jgi:hypothetical protein
MISCDFHSHPEGDTKHQAASNGIDHKESIMDEQDDDAEAIRLCFSKFPGRDMWIPSCVPLDHHNNPRAILIPRHKSGKGLVVQGGNSARLEGLHLVTISLFQTNTPDEFTSG